MHRNRAKKAYDRLETAARKGNVQSTHGQGQAMDTCACLTMNGVGKLCAGEPHARFDKGPLGKVTHPAGAAGPGPVRWKMPPRWPGRDLNRRSDPPNQRPISLPTNQAWAARHERPMKRQHLSIRLPPFG